MKRWEYHPDAAEELVEAVRWYQQEAGMGRALLDEIAVAMENAAAASATRGGGRRVVLERFPYWLVFVEDGDRHVVVAVAHQRRTPGYWKRRKPGGGV